MIDSGWWRDLTRGDPDPNPNDPCSQASIAPITCIQWLGMTVDPWNPGLFFKFEMPTFAFSGFGQCNICWGFLLSILSGQTKSHTFHATSVWSCLWCGVNGVWQCVEPSYIGWNWFWYVLVKTFTDASKSSKDSLNNHISGHSHAWPA